MVENGRNWRGNGRKNGGKIVKIPQNFQSFLNSQNCGENGKKS